MDSVTHAALGAAVAGLVAGRNCSRQILFWGAVLGTLPDFDVLIDWGDAVSNVTKHRSFTHSFFVLLPLSWLMAFFVNHFVRPLQFNLYSLWALIAGCLITHPLVDSFTSYGTQLFWPLRWQPVALSSVFIVDPLYSLPLLIGFFLLFCLPLRPMTLYLNGLGILISTVYLFLSLMLQASVMERVNDTLEHRNMLNTKVQVSPMPFSTLLWRVIVVDDDIYHEGIVSVMDNELEPVDFHSFKRVNAGRNYNSINAYKKLKWFTNGFIAVKEEDEKLLVTDLRLGIYELHPLRFVIANLRGEVWEATTPYLVHDQNLRASILDVLRRMWRRLIGHELDVCEISTDMPCA